MAFPSLSELAPHGTTFVALTIAAVLLTPGPTNTLLFLAGSRDGIRRSLPLIAAEWVGYLISIGVWCVFLALAAAVAPWAPPVARACAAVYIAWSAIKLWRTAPQAGAAGSKGIGPRDLFTVTLLNPKAFFFATVVFPPLAAGPAALLEAYLIFSALLLPIAALWISMGAAVLAYPSATPRQPMVHRIASVVLMGFSGSICYTLLAR
ncbi:UNVERIFIED_ORG: threonine/homoserine/homoserine lactone efflux protein [Zoogloea ramigera]|uniref:LysE family transporter n=1 Tax=Duganella zoogloeoides TaxID=75659 RepID=A0ABZ0Y3Q4_9BURK|nr:LysE family transporter [Duganella zoogloeoides]WQH06489.1 LysE family transporter [Duganella zoogloeoides]